MVYCYIINDDLLTYIKYYVFMFNDYKWDK